jgi:hypothetical protein
MNFEDPRYNIDEWHEELRASVLAMKWIRPIIGWQVHLERSGLSIASISYLADIKPLTLLNRIKRYDQKYPCRIGMHYCCTTNLPVISASIDFGIMAWKRFADIERPMLDLSEVIARKYLSGAHGESYYRCFDPYDTGEAEISPEEWDYLRHVTDNPHESWDPAPFDPPFDR